ncbi:MAG TPA: bifunctional oligoribonuclease/PAP phosphatase NrnA [Gemmatimonadaceae bacterium]
MPLSSLLDVPAERRDAIARIADALRGIRTAAVTTHINADGDACGSVAAMARLLPNLGVTPWIVNPTPWPTLFGFLLGDDLVDRTGDGVAAVQEADAVIALDVSDIKRLGLLTNAVREKRGPRIVIDHHVPTQEPAGDLMLADTAACATGELLYDFATALDLPITHEVAVAIYCAILTDTGGFRYSNTTPRCHAIAADLLRRGVDPEYMYRRIYASLSPGRLHLLRDALDTLGVDERYGIAWVSVRNDALERYEVSAEDLDGIVEHPRSIAGTRVALFFRDLGYGKVKVSFRSTGDVDVNELARKFGGGGHAKASGALVAGTLEQVQDRVVEATRAYVGPAVSVESNGSGA